MLLLLNDCFSKHLTLFFLVLFAYKSWWIHSERCTHLTLNHTLRICWGWSSILIHWITLILRFIVWLLHLWLFVGIHPLIFWYDCSFQHSHKKWKDSLETQAVYIEIPSVSWNLLNGQKHQGSILKNMASSEGNQLLAGAFHAIMGKIETGILQIVKK